MTFEWWNERFNEYRTISAVGAASEIASWPPEILADWKAEREKLIAEVERLREYSAKYVQQRDECGIAMKAVNQAYLYQRRHRRWALEEAKLNLEDLRWVQESQSWQDRGRVAQAEAELAELNEVALDLNERLEDCAIENRRLQERVRVLEEGKTYSQIVTQIQTLDVLYQGAGMNIEDALMHCGLVDKRCAAIAQKEEYPRIAQEIEQALQHKEGEDKDDV